MKNIDYLIAKKPFGHSRKEKNELFYKAMVDAYKIHYENDFAFKSWSDKLVNSKQPPSTIEHFPFFPSAIFKHYSYYKDIGEKEKIIESSGTSGQSKSKILIDSITSRRQTITLSKILNTIIENRRPYFIIDIKPGIYLEKNYSARFAGMAGYLMGASKKYYCLVKEQKDIYLDISLIENESSNLNKKNKDCILIGYTYMIYKHIINNAKLDHIPFFNNNTKLIHFGGWKKLKSEKISKADFNDALVNKLGIKVENIIDIYGFTEQLGTIYPSFGNSGNRVPIYSDVIVRNPQSLQPVNDGEKGFLQFLSPIPNSYPGISLLNDDIGRIVKRVEEQNTYHVEFEVTGRPDNAEARGCGDTLPERYYI